MTIDQAIEQACASVGIVPPKARGHGRWLTTNTLDGGKAGKGDGRVILNDRNVTAFNWRTGEKQTVWIDDRPSTPKERRIIAQQIKVEQEKKQAQAGRAARTAQSIVGAAVTSTHPYLSAKGFPSEQALVIEASHIRRHVGDYLIAGEQAIVMPARLGNQIRSVQLIWEDGTKKFLAGGQIEGTCHRVARGNDHWLCEGFATGLTLRAALKGLKRTDTVLCCFSAANVLAVSRSIKGRCFIVTDNDKPIEHFDSLGTGEHYARISGKPYVMPPQLGDDLNDMHMKGGIFAVQKLLATFVREARRS